MADDMEGEHLQPQIDLAQRALEMALEDACAIDFEEVDTGELIRIEESLAVASKAAKQAVSLRLRRRTQRGQGGSPGQTADQAPQADEERTAKHRIFDDIRGKRWHAFAVHPSSATVERAALPESYRQGWLSFESSTEVRRVAPIPENWEQLSIEDLRILCHSAGPVPRRVGDLRRDSKPKPQIGP